MSRIGKKGIVIPPNTEVKLEESFVLVKGPLGELKLNLHPKLSAQLQENQVVFSPKEENIESRALWGTYTSHLSNMVKGVNKPFDKKLLLEGIGYRAELKGDKLQFALGFSHPVLIDIPTGIKVTIEKNLITVSGIDKEMVGSFTAHLRDLKKPEPYKGKGIRYEKEVIKIKQGKKNV